MSTTDHNDTDVWKATAKAYAEQVGRLTSLYAHDMLNLLQSERLQRATTILDVGCGTGAFVLAYIQQYPNGIEGQTIISSDLSPAMIEQAQLAIDTVLSNNNNNNNNSNNASDQSAFKTKLVFQIEDGTKLSNIDTASIDIVVSLYGVFLIPNQIDTIQSIRRVLKPKTGLFINVAWTKPQLTNIDPSFGNNLQTIFLVIMETIKKMTTPPSTASNEDDVDSEQAVIPKPIPSFMEWMDPQIIETNLTQKYQFTTIDNDNDMNNKKVITYRTFHSLIVPNMNTFYNVLLTNPMIGNVQLLSSEQLVQVRELAIQLCYPNIDDMTVRHTMVEKNVPFTVWSSSNITFAHI